jgi:Heavy metal binding domain
MRVRAVLTAAIVLIASSWSSWARIELGVRAQQPAAPTITFYCPMHPEITSSAAGSCSRCGMKLVAGDPLDFREYLVDVSATPRAVQPGRQFRLTFTVRHPETRNVVRSFATVHDKQYHLFVVSHDLEYYDHIHPEMLPDGSWVIDTKVPKAGYYKLFSDFLPAGGTPQVVPELLVTAGNAGDLQASHPRLPPEDSFQQVAGSMTVTLTLSPDGLVAGRDEKLQYRIVDTKTGQPVTNLEPYLAAYGHTLVLSEDSMEYVHAHPVELIPDKGETAIGGPDLTFKALLPKPGRYRLWTQLKRGGVVSTARFTVTAASPAGR